MHPILQCAPVSLFSPIFLQYRRIAPFVSPALRSFDLNLWGKAFTRVDFPYLYGQFFLCARDWPFFEDSARVYPWSFGIAK